MQISIHSVHIIQVQIRTDKPIVGGEALAGHVRTVVEKTLYHYAERVGDMSGKPGAGDPART